MVAGNEAETQADPEVARAQAGKPGWDARDTGSSSSTWQEARRQTAARCARVASGGNVQQAGRTQENARRQRKRRQAGRQKARQQA